MKRLSLFLTVLGLGLSSSALMALPPLFTPSSTSFLYNEYKHSGESTIAAAYDQKVFHYHAQKTGTGTTGDMLIPIGTMANNGGIAEIMVTSFGGGCHSHIIYKIAMAKDYTLEVMSMEGHMQYETVSGVNNPQIQLVNQSTGASLGRNFYILWDNQSNISTINNVAITVRTNAQWSQVGGTDTTVVAVPEPQHRNVMYTKSDNSAPTFVSYDVSGYNGSTSGTMTVNLRAHFMSPTLFYGNTYFTNTATSNNTATFEVPTTFSNKVTLTQPQGDISMGIYQ